MASKSSFTFSDSDEDSDVSRADSPSVLAAFGLDFTGELADFGLRGITPEP
jgi:hypothetical protein